MTQFLRKHLFKIFLGALVSFALFVAFYPRSHVPRLLRSYPFSSWRMFSDVKQQEEIPQGSEYSEIGVRVEVDSTPPLADEEIAKLNREFRHLEYVVDLRILKGEMDRVWQSVGRKLRRGSYEVREIRVSKVAFGFSTVEGVLRQDVLARGLFARSSRPGEVRGLVGLLKKEPRSKKLQKREIDLKWTGLENPQIELYALSNWTPPIVKLDSHPVASEEKSRQTMVITLPEGSRTLMLLARVREAVDGAADEWYAVEHNRSFE